MFELADAAAATWGSERLRARIRQALVLWQAFVGTRPAEAYGLVREGLDVSAGRGRDAPATDAVHAP